MTIEKAESVVFVDSTSNKKIILEKTKVPTAGTSTSGTVKLSDAVNSELNAETGLTAATPYAVKQAYDLANSALEKVNTSTSGEQTFEGNKIFNGKITASGGITGNLTGNVTGNASTATKLAAPRTIRTNLASTAAASFDGSANVTPGVTGTLPAANGGTGRTDGVAVNVTQKKSLTAKGDIGYGTNNGYLVDVSALSFWDGSYSDGKSNLTYCANGSIVGTSGNQTIGGNKTFRGTTTLNGKTVTKALDTNGNADISGTLAVHGKFTGSGGGALTGAWTCPTPTANTHLANKAYVDSSISSGGGVFVDVSKAIKYTHTDLFVSEAKQYSAEATGMFYLEIGSEEVGNQRVSINSDKRLANIVKSFKPTVRQAEHNPPFFYYYFPVKKGEALYLGPNRSNRTISYYIIPFA